MQKSFQFFSFSQIYSCMNVRCVLFSFFFFLIWFFFLFFGGQNWNFFFGLLPVGLTTLQSAARTVLLLILKQLISCVYSCFENSSLRSSKLCVACLLNFKKWSLRSGKNKKCAWCCHFQLWRRLIIALISHVLSVYHPHQWAIWECRLDQQRQPPLLTLGWYKQIWNDFNLRKIFQNIFSMLKGSKHINWNEFSSNI